MGVLIDENSALRQENANLFQQLDRLRLEIAQKQTNHDQLLQKSLYYDHVVQTLNDLQKEYNHIQKQLTHLQKENDRDTEENKHCKNI
ncbi:unnamed protein product [Rotaria sp. Silwood1]|nr:unnamed protein product [Rotaria sp. Silwood1]CAF1453239.1 unnamed protein product [Rotaria sp. Silwood1]CAF5044639.1 unnamed protein product [Rotaria sp. Silwood1]